MIADKKYEIKLHISCNHIKNRSAKDISQETGP